jgi:hypothetical protein
MSPIAAYYVMLLTESDRDRQARPVRTAARKPRASRITLALEALGRLGRPSTTQPI